MRSSKTGAVAIFVKTPGLSPIKTRLASSIGSTAAEGFHLLSAKAVESVVKQASDQDSTLIPYWAVAEKEALDSGNWKNYQTIWQGDGSLGERLAHVYDELIRVHSFVIFLGADAPLITSRLLKEAALTLGYSAEPSFVMGGAKDGGFYLFGGSTAIPHSAWLDVSYSTATTASELARSIEPLGRLKELDELLDVDTIEDMEMLLSENSKNFELTLEQRALLNWVIEYFKVRK